MSGHRGRLELVVPVGMGARRAAAVLAGRADWIARKLDGAARRRGRVGLLGLDRPGVAWLAGVALPIRVDAGGGRVARRIGDELWVGPAEPEGSIERWYRRVARDVLGEAVDREGARLGLAPARISIRDPRSRWGPARRPGPCRSAGAS